MRTCPSRRRICSCGVALSLAIASLFAQDLTITFDEDTPGQPPPGFVFAALRQTTVGTWEVLGDGTRRHLAHLADSSAPGLSMAVATAPAPEQLLITSRIRFVDGGRTGGLLWRYRDASNLYGVAVNLLAHEAVLHRVVGGNRVQLDRVGDINIDPEIWHTLGVLHRDGQITVHLDGIAVLRAQDRGFELGRAGVWSAGASTTWFDDVSIRSPGPRP